MSDKGKIFKAEDVTITWNGIDLIPEGTSEITIEKATGKDLDTLSEMYGYTRCEGATVEITDINWGDITQEEWTTLCDRLSPYEEGEDNE